MRQFKANRIEKINSMSLMFFSLTMLNTLPGISASALSFSEWEWLHNVYLYNVFMFSKMLKFFSRILHHKSIYIHSRLSRVNIILIINISHNIDRNCAFIPMLSSWVAHELFVPFKSQHKISCLFNVKCHNRSINER